MCSRFVRAVSMLSKSFVEIYSHSMAMKGQCTLGCKLQILPTGESASTDVAYKWMHQKPIMRMPGVEPGSQAWEACMMPLHYMRLLLLINQTVRYSHSCTTWTAHAANQKGAVGPGLWPYSRTACPVSSHTYCTHSAFHLSGFMAAGHQSW